MGGWVEGGEGVSPFSPKFGRKTRPQELPNKWTFYEAPLSKKQPEKSSGNGENSMLIAPRWSASHESANGNVGALVTVKKRFNKLGGERNKKRGCKKKDIQYPTQPRVVLLIVVKKKNLIGVFTKG